MPELLRNYKPVTAERLKKPEDGDWLSIRRTYDGWGYSPLDQITPANVARLQPAWVFATGVTNGHEAPPIVNNGVMFVATPGNQVIAIDAKTGAHALALPPAAARGRHPASSARAAASPVSATRSSSRRAKRCWSRSMRRPARKSGPTTVADNKQGYYMSVAPLVADGKVMVGASGGELGVRGFVAAYDAETGSRGVEDLHGACAWRAGQRDVAEGRSVEDRRRLGLGHRHLRSGDEPRVLGHRQRRPVDGRPAPRRQSLHLVDGRDRRRDRQHQGSLPVRPERILGLG